MRPKQSVGLHQGIWVALVHVFSFAALCAHFSALAQASTLQLDAAAHQAGMFQAFRICLKQERDANQISAEDYRRCDSTAERLYFGLYNTVYAQARNISIATQFVNGAQKIVDAVKGHPALCQGDADFIQVGTAVAQDIKAFYPDHPYVSCGTVPLPCWCDAQNIDKTTLTPAHSLWKGLQLSLRGMKVYTDYCAGTTMDGIEFLPQSTNVAPPQGSPGYPLYAMEPHCDAKDVHLRQFIYTRCADGYDCGTNKGLSCGTGKAGITRNFNTWYLDETWGVGGCGNPQAPHFLSPDSSQDPTWTGPHVINDEPTPNIPNLAGYPPLEETFHDVVMCEIKQRPGVSTWQVLGALTWTRTGVKPPQTPRWCSTKDGRLKVTKDAPYSDLRAEDPRSQTVRDVVCAVVTSKGFVTDPGLNVIVNNFGGCP